MRRGAARLRGPLRPGETIAPGAGLRGAGGVWPRLGSGNGTGRPNSDRDAAAQGTGAVRSPGPGGRCDRAGRQHHRVSSAYFPCGPVPGDRTDLRPGTRRVVGQLPGHLRRAAQRAFGPVRRRGGAKLDTHPATVGTTGRVPGLVLRANRRGAGPGGGGDRPAGHRGGPEPAGRAVEVGPALRAGTSAGVAGILSAPGRAAGAHCPDPARRARQ